MKSGPATLELAPLRLICMTPTTRSPERIGALMIFWMSSAFSAANLTPSKTVACFTEVKSLMISGRLSRVVRAASAVLLESGMKPTFFSASGTTKCKCRQRCETPRMATSSVRTERLWAMRWATDAKEICAGSLASPASASASRSSSITRFMFVPKTTPCLSRPGERSRRDYRCRIALGPLAECKNENT